MAKKTQKIRVKLVKSPIGRKPEQRATLKALGLGKVNSSVEKTANPAVSSAWLRAFPIWFRWRSCSQMSENTLKAPVGANKNRKILGRGRATGVGKTSGRGHNGQKSRSQAAVFVRVSKADRCLCIAGLPLEDFPIIHSRLSMSW